MNQIDQEAFNIVAQACAAVQADLPTHERVQQALAHIQSRLTPVEKPAKTKESKKVKDETTN